MITMTHTHTHTPTHAHSVGLLWTIDRPVAGTSTWRHTQIARDRHPCPRQGWNPQFHQTNDRRHTLNHAATRMGAIR